MKIVIEVLQKKVKHMHGINSLIQENRKTNTIPTCFMSELLEHLT